MTARKMFFLMLLGYAILVAVFYSAIALFILLDPVD